MKIYKPTIEQIKSLIPLWKGQYEYHSNLDNVYYVPNSPELTKKFIAHLEGAINNDAPRILVAEKDNKIVGFITYEIEENDYMDAKITKYGVIVEMFVDPEYRKQGIATQLMNEVESYFLQEGLSHVEIQLSTSNKPAMRLYEGNGYINRQTFVFKEINKK